MNRNQERDKGRWDIKLLSSESIDIRTEGSVLGKNKQTNKKQHKVQREKELAMRLELQQGLAYDHALKPY